MYVYEGMYSMRLCVCVCVWVGVGGEGAMCVGGICVCGRQKKTLTKELNK